MRLKSTTGGEIVQVQGGHIIRATGRKDHHSKVFTAKGPRDRRVRLAAHTAIQFYDVQDRLGYDRPSKAVDWLIKKAKASIDNLAELPPWDPMASGTDTVDFHVGDQSGGSSSFYVPRCLDSESLGDQSMKSFFPITSNENSISFQTYPDSQNSQDLCLSLNTVQDPGGGSAGAQNHTHSGHGSGLFQGSGSSFGFDGGTGWVESQQQHELGRFTRMFGLLGGGGGGNGGGGGEGRGGMMFQPPPFPPQGVLFGEQGPMTLYSQRSTLRSSFLSPLVHHHNHHHQEISGVGHGSDEFMRFCVPTQFHELHGGEESDYSAFNFVGFGMNRTMVYT